MIFKRKHDLIEKIMSYKFFYFIFTDTNVLAKLNENCICEQNTVAKMEAFIKDFEKSVKIENPTTLKNLENVNKSSKQKNAILKTNFSEETKRHFKKHKSIVHEGLRDHKCEKCDKYFISASFLKRHISNYHELTKHKRDFHNQKFKKSKNYEMRENLNPCAKNHKKYSKIFLNESKNSIDEGVKIRHLQSKLLTENENTKNIHGRQKKSHLISVHEGVKRDLFGKNQKSQKCELCGKVFSESEFLKIHLKIAHEGFRI